MCGLYGIHLLLGARKRPVRCRRLEQSALHELDQGCMAVLSLIRAHHKTRKLTIRATAAYNCCIHLLLPGIMRKYVPLELRQVPVQIPAVMSRRP